MNSMFILILAMLSIQFGASMAKNLFAYLSPETVTSARILFASILLAIIFKPCKLVLSKKEKIYIVGYGISLGLMNLTFYKALKFIPLGVVVAIEFLGPLFISFIYSRKKSDILWAVLAGFGIYLITPFGTDTKFNLMGIIYAFCAAICWALYIVFGKGVGKNQSAMRITSLGMIVACLTTFFFGINELGEVFSNKDLLWKCSLVALFSSAIPYSLEMVSLKNIPEKTFGILMSLEPAIAMMIGIIFLNEYLLVNQYLGILLVIIASIGTTLMNMRRD